MKPLGFPLLADENIHPDVVRELGIRGKDVRTVQDDGLVGAQDVAVIRRAHELGRVVLTHDIDARTVLEVIAAIEIRDDDVTPPFIVVAERREDRIRVRVRHLGP